MSDHDDIPSVLPVSPGGPSRMPLVVIAVGLAVGLFLGGIFVATVYFVVQAKDAQVQAREAEDQVDLVVVKGAIHQGDLITEKELEENFETRRFKKDSAPMNGISVGGADLQQGKTWKDYLKGKVATRNLAKGDLVSLKDFNDGKSFKDFPVGHQAMTVAVKNSADGRFFVPGNRVNVIGNYVSSKKGKGKISKTFLRNILVLAVGTLGDAPEGGKPPTIITVTLAVKPDQAKQLSWVVDSGTITLVLSQPGDDLAIDDHLVDDRGLELDLGH